MSRVQELQKEIESIKLYFKGSVPHASSNQFKKLNLLNAELKGLLDERKRIIEIIDKLMDKKIKYNGIYNDITKTAIDGDDLKNKILEVENERI